MEVVWRHATLTSIAGLLAQKVQIDLDLPPFDVDAPHRVGHERHEQSLGIGALDVERLAGRQRDETPDNAHGLSARLDGAPLEVLLPPLVLLDRGRLLARGEQLL